MVLADILRKLFILELDQLRMFRKLKSWLPSNIFSSYTSATNVWLSYRYHSLQVFWQDRTVAG